tara:strand:- start:514 stop:2007 length:1494 start_codon:yes stop_codon:yes gene_type:complete
MVFPVLGGNKFTTPTYTIDYGVQMDGSTNTYFHRTQSAGSNLKGTFSCWYKRGVTSVAASNAQENLWHSQTDGSNYMRLYINTSNQLDLYVARANSVVTRMTTDSVYRDDSAWNHYYLSFDMTQGTASNRINFKVNGEDTASMANNTVDGQNNTQFFGNNSDVMWIGNEAYAAGENLHGNLADVYWIDGTQYAVTMFAETDSTSGIWKPKQFQGSYGTNGFKMEFKQTGTSANASGIGADTSGNDNHLTPVNFDAKDQTIDTPSNSFPQFNSAFQLGDISSPDKMKEGGRELVILGNNYWRTVMLNMGARKGKWYCEWKINEGNRCQAGIVYQPAAGFPMAADDTVLGDWTGSISWGYQSQTQGDSGGDLVTGGSASSFGATLTTQDTFCIALDLDNDRLHLGKNGTWQNSSDPTSSSSGIDISARSTAGQGDNPAWVFFAASCYNSNIGVNAGQGNMGTIAIGSAQSPDDGLGVFEYDVPAGYRALCTKNLALYGG